MAKPKVRKTIRHAQNAPEGVQAAQIALVLMGVAKAHTWVDVAHNDELAAVVELDAYQQSILEKHAHLLPYLARGGQGRVARSYIGCPTCGAGMFTAGVSAPPKRCLMTMGCDGAPIKAKSTQEPLPKTDE